MSIEKAKRVLQIEAKAVADLVERVGEQFERAVEAMFACEGKVVVIGVGKSGLVGRKIAATLASTGTPAFFVHPVESVHGDLGMIDTRDLILLISNSGETDELAVLAPSLERIAVPVIGLLGRTDSTLAKASDVVIDVSVSEEACPLQLAPTASTTAALAMGDALALSLLERRGFTEEDFACLHPAGALGKRLLLRVSDLMHTGDDLPRVGPQASAKDVIIKISSGMLGHAAVVEDGKVIGVVSDGDLRRAMETDENVFSKTAREIMTVGGKNVAPNALAQSALQIMERHSITALLVIDDPGSQRLAGLIHLHDLLKAGVV